LGMKQLIEDPWSSIGEKYPIGSKVNGRGGNLPDYGAFVELEEGVEGLIHVSEMSWTKKVRNSSKILSEGDQVEAVVLDIDQEHRRVSLGLKQLMPNPWDELAKVHPIGSTVKGKVRSVTEFGIFVGVEDGIDGLVHVSDFSWTRRIKDPKEIQEMFKKGDEVDAVVLDIDVGNERLSLGIKHLDDDPWETITQRYPVGSKVNGTVSSVTDFGVFVEIGEGIEGLIHNSQLGIKKDQDPKEVFPVESVIESEVTNVDREERRISLSVRAIKSREEKADLAEFMQDSGGAVTFGDLLRQKMDDSGEE